MSKNERKLTFQMVPDGCWYYNLRTALPKEAWEYIKTYVKEKSKYKCAICGAESKRLDAHELWSYDKDKKIQKLEDVIAICPMCHKAIHIGLSQLKCSKIELEKIEDHYMKVNNISYSEFRQDLNQANNMHRELNKVDEWVTDTSLLNKIFNITEDKKSK